MEWLSRIFSFFRAPTGGLENRPIYWVTAKCNRCGEIIRSRVDLYNDISIEYGEGGNAKATYFVRKLLLGERCFQKIEVELRFDDKRELLSREIHGGAFADEEPDEE